MAKRKLKRRGKPAFDFVASQPIEECIYRLGQIQHIRGLAHVPTIKIKRHEFDEDTTLFTIRETDPGGLMIQGYFKRLDEYNTQVQGIVSNSLTVYAEIGVMTGIVIILTPMMGWLMGAIFLFLISLYARHYFAGAQEEQNRLIALTVDTLVY